jgi:uncharacterized protein YqjF (DUF2071 family)
MPVVGRMVWEDLAFVHWAVPVAPIARLLPPGLEIDTYQDHAYVGLVPFEMHDVGPRRLPGVPTATDFAETNLRTYVRHAQDGEPGVWFFSLDAASSLAAIGARLGLGLPYYRARMAVEHGDDEIVYRSHRACPGRPDADLIARVRVGHDLGPAEPGTLEHFLVERYVLFAWRRGQLVRARVNHAPYQLCAARVDVLRESLRRAAGVTELGHRLPDLFARRVDVELERPSLG